MEKLGRFELNNIYLEDCYKAIKDIPDKSIDLIYTDIPYEFTSGGKGGLMRNEARQKTYVDTIGQFNKGIDYKILDEFVRVLRYIYIYMVLQRPNLASNEILCRRKRLSI